MLLTYKFFSTAKKEKLIKLLNGKSIIMWNYKV